MKPEWKEIQIGEYDSIHWCQGCGVIKVMRLGNKKPKYSIPRRERERRLITIEP